MKDIVRATYNDLIRQHETLTYLHMIVEPDADIDPDWGMTQEEIDAEYVKRLRTLLDKIDIVKQIMEDADFDMGVLHNETLYLRHCVREEIKAKRNRNKKTH